MGESISGAASAAVEKHWVADVTLYNETGGYCFVPLEGDPEGEHTLILGLNFISDRPPGGEPIVGVVHMDGQAALDEWSDAHPEQVAYLTSLAEPDRG